MASQWFTITRPQKREHLSANFQRSDSTLHFAWLSSKGKLWKCQNAEGCGQSEVAGLHGYIATIQQFNVIAAWLLWLRVLLPLCHLDAESLFRWQVHIWQGPRSLCKGITWVSHPQMGLEMGGVNHSLESLYVVMLSTNHPLGANFIFW